MSAHRISGPRAPSRIWRAAKEAVQAFASGQKNFLIVHRTGYLMIRVSYRWRLLSKNGGQHWRLMTHESYNSERYT